MSGLLWPRVAYAAPLFALIVGGLAGCADDTTTYPLNRFTGYPPGSGDQQGSANTDHVGASLPGDQSGPNAIGFGGSTYGDDLPHFRDYAAYTWVDRGGSQWLSQTLLTLDGSILYDRVCPVDAKYGIMWTQCDPWSPGHDVADLGIGMQTASGFGAFVFTQGTRTVLVQTAFSADGNDRKGRTCPLNDKRVDYNGCSPWDKLELLAADLGVDGQIAFRDQNLYTFVDANNATQFVNTLLSGDGQSSWTQTCTSVSQVVEPTKACFFGDPVATTELKIPSADAVSSIGGFVYWNAGVQLYAETVISMDGTKAARRECLFDAKSGTSHACGGWSYQALSTVLTAQAEL